MVLLPRDHVNHRNGCQMQWIPEMKEWIKLITSPLLMPLMNRYILLRYEGFTVP